MNLYLTNLRWVCDLERHREEEGDRTGNKVVQEYVMLQKMRQTSTIANSSVEADRSCGANANQ